MDHVWYGVNREELSTALGDSSVAQQSELCGVWLWRQFIVWYWSPECPVIDMFLKHSLGYYHAQQLYSYSQQDSALDTDCGLSSSSDVNLTAEVFVPEIKARRKCTRLIRQRVLTHDGLRLCRLRRSGFFVFSCDCWWPHAVPVVYLFFKFEQLMDKYKQQQQ